MAGEVGGDLGVLFFEPVTHVRGENASRLQGLFEVVLVAGERGDAGWSARRCGMPAAGSRALWTTGCRGNLAAAVALGREVVHVSAAAAAVGRHGG
ncbi:MAG TPA: hypothetical protein VMV92_01975 [Streptosporangiaceae bacterium]|nr:hypothetical protein [Streptosporangiaceae bacterium]